tara:strand:- start:5815 stop:9507 length:3693 start_codon:yes stop_codon:yes gene_type:complete
MADKNLELALRIVAEATGKQNIEQLVTVLRNIEQTAETANPAADKLSEQLDKVAEHAKSAAPETEKLADELDDLEEAANGAKPTTDHLNDSLDDTTNSATNTAKSAGKLANQLNDLANQQQLIRNFEQSKQKLEQTEIATAAAARALDELHKQAQDSNKPFVELARGIDLAEKDLQQMRNELTQQTSKHAGLQQALKRSGIDTNNLTAAKRNLGAQFDKAGKAVDNFTLELKQGNAAQQQHAVSLGNVAGQVAALASAYFGLDRVSQAVSSVFATGDKFEKLRVQMNGLMGGIAQGAEATKWIAEFTKNTPLQLGEVSQAFVKLKAFGLDPMDGTLQSITDSALKLGGSYQEVEGISLALGQAWAKQKLQGEEILQLVERGVPVWDMLQNVTGKNVEELQKLSSAGQLGRDVIKDLIDEMGRASAGSAAAQMALFSGQVSNAKDNIEQFYNLVAQSGAMDWLKGQLTELNNQFAEMAADGRLQEWAQAFSDAIVNTGTVIKNTIATLYDFREEIGFVAKAFLALKVGSYFSDVISGAIEAARAFATYKAAVAASTIETNKATVAAGKWRSAIGFLAQGGLYTALINEVINVGIEYNNLLTIEAQVEKSRQAATESSERLKAELALVSEQTGILVTNMEELEEAISSGVIQLNEASGTYENVAQKQQALADATKAAFEAELQRQEFLKLTVPEALAVIEVLDAQANSLNGVRDGVDGFLQSIASATTALQAGGEQYNQQIEHLTVLKAKFEAHNESLERQKYLADDLSAAYKELGLTSAQSLTETATKLQGAFELIQQNNEPIALQQKAFLKWADAAVEAADATDQVVPPAVEAAAAALGLTNELDKLIAKANQLKPATDHNSEAVKQFTRELEQTRQAIRINNDVLNSSIATTEQKAQAQKALNIQNRLVQDQESDLNKVRLYEIQTLQQLTNEQNSLERQLIQIEQQFKNGVITAEEHNNQKQRLSNLLNVVNNLLGDFKNAQDAATNSTKQGTRATEEATKANERSLKSLREQKDELERVTQSANRAASSLKNYASAGPTTSDVANYQEKHEKDSAYSFNSKELEAEKAERLRTDTQTKLYAKYEKQITAATKNRQLNELYKKAVEQISYLSKAQRNELANLIAKQRETIKAQKQARSRSEPNDKSSSNQNSNTDFSSGSEADYYKQANSPSSNNLGAELRELIQLLKKQHSGKTIKLVLQLGNTSTEIYAQVRDELLAELEQLSKSQ